MAKNTKKTVEDAPDEEATKTDPPAPEPEKITTVEDLGIGAGDPYPTKEDQK